MDHKPLLVVATRNTHKTQEIAAMLAGQWRVEDLSSHPDAPHVDETGVTFLENAALKAESASKVIPGVVLADDSGLEVDVLEGRPGVWSSSFGGEEGNHAKNNARMIEELKQTGVDESPARFRCVMVLARDGKMIGEFDGSVEGKIVSRLMGDGGFGYDPLFIPEGYEKSFGQLPQDVKNIMSHRARALKKVIGFLSENHG